MMVIMSIIAVMLRKLISGFAGAPLDLLAQQALVRRHARRLHAAGGTLNSVGGCSASAIALYLGSPNCTSGKRSFPSSSLANASMVLTITWYGMLGFALIVTLVSS